MAADPSPPRYDPAMHTDPAQVVLLEMWCACSLAHRQIDPVSHVLPQIEGWRLVHAGAGHGPVSPNEAITEREARREAAFRMVGRLDEYEPRPRADLPTGAGFDWTETR